MESDPQSTPETREKSHVPSLELIQFSAKLRGEDFLWLFRNDSTFHHGVERLAHERLQPLRDQLTAREEEISALKREVESVLGHLRERNWFQETGYLGTMVCEVDAAKTRKLLAALKSGMEGTR